jgi:hypothetical protein
MFFVAVATPLGWRGEAYLPHAASTAGVPIEDSAAFLSDLRHFALEAARLDGYADEEIVSFLSPPCPFLLPGGKAGHLLPLGGHLLPSLGHKDFA